MTKKESCRVRTLTGFMKWAAQFNDPKYLFRGVPNEKYKIQASAYRRLSKADRKNPSRLLRINQRLIEDARSRGHDQKNGQQLSDLELLAELQHFGAATCLIDFSRSALVALWFACLENSTEEGEANGKVYAVDRDIRLKTINPELIKEGIDHFLKPDKNNRYQLYQWEPKLQNNRIIAQQSVFVFGGAQIQVAAQCIIMQSSKQEILKSLDNIFSITEASMYPDFDGFARLHVHNKPYVELDAHDNLRRGIEAHQHDNLDDAIAYYSEVIRLSPTDTAIFSEAYNNLGVAYKEKGDYDFAIGSYRRAIALKPDYAEAYNNRGEAYRSKGELDDAIVDYNMAIKLKPNYAEAYDNRGALYLGKDKFDRAIKDYTKAIELNSNNADVYNRRGVAHMKKDDSDLAIEDFTKAIELNPGDVNPYKNRGNVYFGKGKYNLAIKDYTKVIELSPGDVDYYNQIDADPTIEGDDPVIYLKWAYTHSHIYRCMARLYLGEWEGAKSDLIIAKAMGEDIAAAFRHNYESISDFNQKHGVQLPDDLVEILTPPA